MLDTTNLPDPESVTEVARIRNPVRRVLVLQVLRATPIPMFRLVAPLVWAGAILIWRLPPGAPVIAAGLGFAALWLMPLRSISAGRVVRARTFVALPLNAAGREGKDPIAPLLAALPVVLAASVAVAVWTLP